MSKLDERLADLLEQWEEDVRENERAFSQKDRVKDDPYGWILTWKAKWSGEAIARCLAELREALGATENPNQSLTPPDAN